MFALVSRAVERKKMCSTHMVIQRFQHSGRCNDGPEDPQKDVDALPRYEVNA